MLFVVVSYILLSCVEGTAFFFLTFGLFCWLPVFNSYSQEVNNGGTYITMRSIIVVKREGKIISDTNPNGLEMKILILQNQKG